MDKKILSTSLSLACHTIFLILALNLVLTPPSNSEPISPPILIHVHLDPRPFSQSMGNNGQMSPIKNLVMVPQQQITKIVTPQAPAIPYKKPIVSNEHVVTVVKENVPSRHTPTQRNKHKALISTKQVFEDMKVSNRQMATSSIMPLSNVSNQIQESQMKPSLESEMQNVQGQSPYLPFDLNGSGTDIKSFLGYDLYTYEDPVDHAKYFKLSIRVEDIPGSLVPLPKEITFLIDASASIGNQLLENFKSGVEKSVQELGSDDKFNVIVFNDQVSKFQDHAIPSSPSNLQPLHEYLSNFQSGSTTDLYDTILKSVTSIHSMKPAYLFLLSDGQPTESVTDSMKLINKISEIDHGDVPVFGFGAGAYNEYLMNFITFDNRGWGEFDAAGNTVQNIVDMYDHIKDPVLLNVRYYSSGLDRDQIYPKTLPDLFKGSEFVLYGRYNQAGDFIFQLRGDAQNDIKQYLIKDNLNNGHPGDRTIAQEWAMRKIFDLIGQLQYDENNQTLIDEINELATKFNLKIPQYTK